MDDALEAMRRQRSLVFALTFAIFTAAAGTQAITPLFPELKRALGVDDAAVRALTAVYTLGYSFAGFVLGMTSDRVGRRRVLLTSLAVFLVSNLALGFVSDYGSFLALRTLSGLATGGISSAALALAADTVSFEHRGKAMATVTAGNYAAALFGMPLASQLAEYGLLWVFPALALIALAAFLGLVRLCPRGVPPVVTESRRSMMRRAVATTPARAALVTTFFHTIAAYAIVTSLADAAVDRFAATHGQRTFLFLVLGVGSLAGAIGAQRYSDRLGKRRAILGALGVSLATMPLVLLPDGITGFAIASGVIAAGAGMRQGPFAAILTELAPGELRGSLVGWNSLFSGLGLSLGTWLGGFLYGKSGLPGVVALGFVTLAISLATFVKHVRLRNDRAAGSPAG